MDDLRDLCEGLEIRVRKPLDESGQALIDALGVRVVIDPLAPARPNWKQMALDVGWNPHTLAPYKTKVEPSDRMEIEASEWLYNNRAPEYVNSAVRDALARSYRRRGGRAVTRTQESAL